MGSPGSPTRFMPSSRRPRSTTASCTWCAAAWAMCRIGERKRVAEELRNIYRAPTEAAALEALRAFERSPTGKRYSTIAPLWRRQWEYLCPVFAYPPAIRRLLYTTNAIESLHMQLRKIIKTRGHFPTDEAATKLLYLAVRNIIAKWKAAPREWHPALPHIAVLFGERFTMEG